MRRLKLRRPIILAVWATLIFWPLYQLYDTFHTHVEKQDAVELLYQVSLFQVEMLNSRFLEAGADQTAKDLEPLKQAAYSVQYTHERLRLALGEDRLAPLESVQELLQYILRLQIGGNRPLKPEETSALQDAAKQFENVYEDYGKLLSSHHQLIGSENAKLVKADKEISEELAKKQRQ